jgi:hypothetical protein
MAEAVAPEAATGGLSLEFADPSRGQGRLTFPVSVAGLSSGGVVLKIEDSSGKLDLLNLKGREVKICLPGWPEENLGRIRGRVLWTRPEGDRGEYSLGLELADPDFRVRKALEDRLEAYPRDLKELWDQWDRVHARRLLPTADQAVYLVGIAAMAGGMGLYIIGPESLKLFGSIMAIYGCLMMAAKSVWTLWQERTIPEE